VITRRVLDLVEVARENLSRGFPMRGSRRSAPIAILLLSCSTPEEPTAPATTLPSETTAELPSIPFEDTGTWEPQDTGGTVTNLDPAATVRIIQEGFWNLGPSGGPYDQIDGWLQINEWPDGEIDTGTDTAVDTAEAPLCDVLFQISGTVQLNSSCPDCDVVFNIDWTYVEGDATPCRDPDMPADGADWRIGYVSATDTIKFDYYHSGVWVDWYEAQQQGDTLHVTYDTTKSVTVEEETQ
jgi:hypothetical protein